VTAKKPVWQAPTRRAFVAMLGLGAAVLATAKVERKVRRKRVAESSTPPLPTRWIGHC
jgi:phosphotransferase system  glucose/maltose/N-acetylglucosamine-specific IIC component